MSPALLSTRLKELERHGVLKRTLVQKRPELFEYRLTSAGEELKSVVEAIGVWGHRWVESDPSLNNLDPSLLMWDMHRRLETSAFPDGRTVLYFQFSGCPANARRWWLVVMDHEVDICMKDPGDEIDLHLNTDMATMARIWMGDISAAAALRQKRLVVTGASPLKRSLSSWLGLSEFAKTNPRLVEESRT